jgi:ATP/maltotriose-dependent transcriptional regulator MalT
MAQATLEQGRNALARRAWPDAYACLSAADDGELRAADLEGLADAAWWLSRFEESIDARQRAYAAYAAAGDDRGATATAARLSIEHFVQNRLSIGAGFLLRARRHAKRVPDGPGHAFLAMVESSVARFGGDIDDAIALGELAIATAERWGDRDVMAMALHAEGLALVDAGRLTEGLACMDEAMASVLSGEVDPYFTGVIFCGLIAACLELHDVRRAGEWSDAARTWCQTLRPDSPFPGMCAVNHAEVARLRGAWPEAESELLEAAEQLDEIAPGLAAPAFVQLGEVRRRTGDLDGAEGAFLRGGELGGDPQPGLGLLRAAQGKMAEAHAELRHAAAAARAPSRRAGLLAALAEVAIDADELEDARHALEDLRAIADDVDSASVTALATGVEGLVRLASADAAGATERLRDAVRVFDELTLPYEAARMRIAHARALFAAGDATGGEIELGAADAQMRRLGAAPDLAVIERLRSGGGHTLPAGLTPREAEVLRLVASGKTNRDIAVELVISEHTVARHMQNMFAKLGVSSRAAATAFAFAHGLT